MQKIIFILFAILLSLSVNGQNDGPWKEFTDYEGRFKVKLPGKFSHKIDTVETPVGLLAYHIYFYNNPSDNPDNVFYMISYCDYPDETVHSDSTTLLEEFFDASMDQAATAVNGELTYHNEAWLEGYPGRLWRIDYLDRKALVKTKAFMVNQRYYAIQVVTIQQKSLNLSTNKFMDSFQLLE